MQALQYQTIHSNGIDFNVAVAGGGDRLALEHLEADVAGLIEASGAHEVVLIGHDWGALIMRCSAGCPYPG